MAITKISVIMPVLNNEEYLIPAIESILSQTESNFEFIIISEFGNNNASLDILQTYAAADERIRLIQNESRLNISASLNLGIDMAQGEYIARMDADDISLPERFARQSDFLDTNLEISICVTATHTINANGNKLNRLDPNPNDPDQIHSDLLFYCPIQHPTAMMRRTALLEADLRYNPDYAETEDYEFWNRAGRRVRIARLPEALLLYRLHSSNASRLRREPGIENFLTVMQDNFLRFDMCFSNEQLRILCPITCEMTLRNFMKYCRFVKSVANEIMQKNKTIKLYDQDSLIKTLQKRMFWYKAPWRLVIAVTARSAASVIRIFSSKASYVLYRTAFCVETYGVRGFIRMLTEYIREREKTLPSLSSA